jgi:3-keto-5-aminohexanoate cleavage enzyme
VMPELEVYEAGMLEHAFKLVKNGVLSGPLHFQFVLGVPGGMSGEARNLLHLINVMESGAAGSAAYWGVAGIGRYQLPLAVQALVLGGHVRVGLEDNIFYHKGELAKSNAQLVERVARIAREIGRPVATVADARRILGF